MTRKDPRKPVVVTAGEPAGIGPELCLRLAHTPHFDRLLVIADPVTLRVRAERTGSDVRIREYDGNRQVRDGELLVIPQELPKPRVCGIPDTANASALLEGLKAGVAGCLSGEYAALVTAPLQKSVINDAGIAFSGHTELLAELTGSATPVMLLVGKSMRVALATTHLPLRDVPDELTQEGLTRVMEVLLADLVRLFGIAKPSVIVCGLNPHAGEGGHLGKEDASIIAPVVKSFRERGFDVRGPLPADTAFTPAAGPRDAIIAMYHDQGLPVLKYASFGAAVNVTLGL
ncbi:MAG TPA: 4-hydroxythreonine-4-phosphate dehydrogenase PdxA, partial [Woeseiaceae bacterium]|nr:4-hydroxythreonine-4-phosphate dehydrogenase PdxA [Woeseiaceae bacterium]